MRRIVALTLIAGVATCAGACALAGGEPLGASDRLASLPTYVATYPRHVGATLAPLADVKRDAIVGGGIAALVLLAAQTDGSVDRYVAAGHTLGDGLDRFGSDTLPHLLTLGYVVPAVGDALIRGQPGHAVLRVEAMVEALNAQAIIVESLKHAIGRRRPNGARYAFPSGHTGWAFAAAGLTDASFGHGAGAVAFAGATVVGASRVTLRRHWVSDLSSGSAEPQ